MNPKSRFASSCDQSSDIKFQKSDTTKRFKTLAHTKNEPAAQRLSGAAFIANQNMTRLDAKKM